MKTPLIILTTAFGISFLDGMFSWYLADGFYVLLNLAIMVALTEMWIIQYKNK